jgi:peptide-methionine (R)-S-oxide reductase
MEQKLTPEQYHILREKGTEAPYGGRFLYHKDPGTYVCVACGNKLFSSKAKYDSDTPGFMGWPSFFEAVDTQAVEFKEDTTFGMSRTEVMCKKCGGHLGHIFADDTAPQGTHYCINSGALDFIPKK